MPYCPRLRPDSRVGRLCPNAVAQSRLLRDPSVRTLRLGRRTTVVPDLSVPELLWLHGCRHRPWISRRTSAPGEFRPAMDGHELPGLLGPLAHVDVKLVQDLRFHAVLDVSHASRP